MSTQELDVKKAWRAIRRHRRIVAAAAAAGLIAGLGLALLRPPMHTATSLVVLPPPVQNANQSSTGSTQNIDTQVFIANSEPVLKSAGQNLNPPLPTDVVRERVKVTATILDRDLRADALRIATSRQVLQGGQWVDAPVAAATVQKLEEIILTRARDLRRNAIAS